MRYLTKDIATEYRRRARFVTETKPFNAIADELRQLCHITELEAVNILRGYNISDYVNKYTLLKAKEEAKNRPPHKASL